MIVLMWLRPLIFVVVASVFLFQRASKACHSIPLSWCFHSGVGVMSKRFQTQSLSKGLC